ncbi:MAG: M20/M25/M40 family metallo-hydrolase [Thioploca sp.]|nr:M20/M25/M40 family metallo-hydrolase [Thioploca sp.]
MVTQLLPLSLAEQESLAYLEVHVKSLASDARGRNHYLGNTLIPSRNYITEQFQVAGYDVLFQEYSYDNITYANIEVELLGNEYPDEIIVIGAHYDSVLYSPGANDNASGVAAVLEIARLLNRQALSRTVRLIAFVNEEPPFFQTEAMGSLVYAKRSAVKKENIVAMFTLETIGYFSDEPGSQTYPPVVSYFYPDSGNFIAFVSNLNSRQLLQESVQIFQEQATIPAEAAALPAFIPGVGWSDQWSFWQYGYPGIMITDTAIYRYPYYHTPQDTPDKIDYERMARVVIGVHKMIEKLLL